MRTVEPIFNINHIKRLKQKPYNSNSFSLIALGCKNSRRLYISHQPSRPGGGDMKLFHFSSVLGEFKASLVSSAYVPSPYPYLQDHLYNVSQPGKQRTKSIDVYFEINNDVVINVRVRFTTKKVFFAKRKNVK